MKDNVCDIAFFKNWYDITSPIKVMLGTSLKKRALLIKRLIQAVRSLDSRDFDMKGKFGGVLKKLPNFDVIPPLNTSKNSIQSNCSWKKDLFILQFLHIYYFSDSRYRRIKFYRIYIYLKTARSIYHLFAKFKKLISTAVSSIQE